MSEERWSEKTEWPRIPPAALHSKCMISRIILRLIHQPAAGEILNSPAALVMFRMTTAYGTTVTLSKVAVPVVPCWQSGNPI